MKKEKSNTHDNNGDAINPDSFKGIICKIEAVREAFEYMGVNEDFTASPEALYGFHHILADVKHDLELIIAQ